VNSHNSPFRFSNRLGGRALPHSRVHIVQEPMDEPPSDDELDDEDNEEVAGMDDAEREAYVLLLSYDIA
jgi:hypothetical protein